MKILNVDMIWDPTVNACVDIWSDVCGENVPFSITQSHWDTPMVKAELRELLVDSKGSDTIRLSVLSSNCGGGEWLNACPIKNCGLLMNDNEFRINIGLRLGADTVHPHQCASCNIEVTGRGNHGLSCRSSKGRHSRHTEANEILSKALTTIGLAPLLEPPGISRMDGKRPDGLTRVPWSRGLCLIWDFTCVDTLAVSRINCRNLNAADEAETRKIKKYENLTDTYIFQPISVETLGQWGSTSLKFLKSVGRKLAEVTGEPRSGYFLRQRLSIAVSRGNASSCLGTLSN